jgi:hypothetical protein
VKVIYWWTSMNRIMAAVVAGIYIGMMNPLLTAYGEGTTWGARRW